MFFRAFILLCFFMTCLAFCVFVAEARDADADGVDDALDADDDNDGIPDIDDPDDDNDGIPDIGRRTKNITIIYKLIHLV